MAGGTIGGGSYKKPEHTVQTEDTIANTVFHPQTIEETRAILQCLKDMGCTSGYVQELNQTYFWAKHGIFVDKNKTCMPSDRAKKSEQSVKICNIYDLKPNYGDDTFSDKKMMAQFNRLAEKVDAQAEEIRALNSKLDQILSILKPAVIHKPRLGE